MEQTQNQKNKRGEKKRKYTSSKDIEILDISLFENPLCYLFIIHNHEHKVCPKINSITKKKGISYLNNEKAGKFLCSYKTENNTRTHNVYINRIQNRQTEPNQIILLPKSPKSPETPLEFKIYIKCLKTEISAKTLYKHIS
jgi:hypothetical protein